MTEYTMRPLNMSDAFKMSRILKKLDIKTAEVLKNIDVKKITSKAKKGNALEEVGLQAVAELAQKVAENLYLAENEVNEFMASLVGIKAEDFAKLPLEDGIKIFSLFKEQKGIGSFLQAAVK